MREGVRERERVGKKKREGGRKRLNTSLVIYLVGGSSCVRKLLTNSNINKFTGFLCQDEEEFGGG
jgi:hypothetical protein